MLTLDPALIRNHIAGEVPAFRFVGLAADLGKITAESLVFPSAFIVSLGELAGENHYENDDMIEQAITARLGIVMAVRDIADRSGAVATTSLKPLREAVLGLLCSYVPEQGGQALRFARGALQSGVDGTGALFWQDDYTLRFNRRIQIIRS